ncbi:MAG: hypothetical protein ACOY37_08095 [Pseudomonadota bacterium]
MSSCWAAPLRRAVLGVAVLLSIAAAAPAAERAEVGFAGVAYTGAAAGSGERLPHASAVLGRIGLQAYARRLRDALERTPARHISWAPAERLQVLDGSGASLVMAVALDRETVTQERIDGRWKVLYELAGQALFFDFREKQVLFAYPLTLQYIDMFDAPPTEAALEAMAARVLDGTGPGRLPEVTAAELASLSLPNASSRRLQVVGTRLSDLAAGKLAPGQRDAALVGHEFTKILASTLRLPMLPHAAGQAIGGVMPARFADGSVHQLRIPEPDYRIDVTVEDLRDKTLSQQGGFRQQLYGAFFHVTVSEPLSGRIYLDQPLRQGSTKAIPGSQDIVDSSGAYYETLLAGFASLAQSLDGGAKPWASEQTGGRVFTQQLKSLKELVQQCR